MEAPVETEEVVLVSDVLPHIDVPIQKRATPEEIARRRKLFEQVMRLRDQMPPLGFDAAELIREVREGPNLAND